MLQLQKQWNVTMRRDFDDLTDDAVFKQHGNLLCTCGNVVLAKQFKRFVIDDFNRDIVHFLLYYFNNCKKAEDVFPGKGYTIHKNLMICGEVGRGFAILGLSVGVPVIGTVGAILCSGYDHSVTFGSAVTIVALGSLAVYVWNIVDAVQVAKIKNMYCRDIRNTYSASLKLYPSVGIIPASGGSRTSVGLTLALNFR